MKLNFYALLLTPFLLFSSCKEIDTNILRKVPFKGEKLTKINLDNIPAEVIEVKFSEIFSDYQIIPLETKKECVIGNTTIQFSKDFIFIGTQNFPGAAKLYRFDKQGLFINEIGKEGRGPGEHNGYLVTQVLPFEEDNTILVNWGGGDPQLFDFAGSYKGEIHQPIELLGNIYKLSSNEWFSTGSCAGIPNYSRDSLKMIFYNNEGGITKTIPRIEFPNLRSGDYTPMGGWNSVYKFNNQWNLYFSGVDTLYKMINKSLVPTIVFIRGRNGMTYNVSIPPSDLPGKYDIKILAETDNNLFLQEVIIKEAVVKEWQPGKWNQRIVSEYKLIIVDKKSKKAAYIKLIDDIFEFLPEEFIHRLVWQNNNSRVFQALQAVDYLRMIKESKPGESHTQKTVKMMEKLKDISENSNPIILSYTLKDRVRID
jgi:hypothetical protein